MDWKRAIERYRVPLLGQVLELFARIGLDEGITIERVPKPLYREVLGILRTAESAVRRLIIAAARDIVVEPRPERPVAPRKPEAPAETKTVAKEEGKVRRKRRPSFNLFDAPRRLKKLFGGWPKRKRPEPRIHFFGEFDPRIPRFLRSQAPVPAPVIAEIEEPVDDGMVDAGPLIRRLLAAKYALEDIQRQARRYALWSGKPFEERHPQRRSALRVGRPPGYRQRPKYEVDEILKECHWLARNVMPALNDTS